MITPELIQAAQDYDLKHRYDDDQPRLIAWKRVEAHQVARLLAGAFEALAKAGKADG